MPYPVQGAAIAPPTTVMSSHSIRRLAILLTALALAVTLVAIESPQATLGAQRGNGHHGRVGSSASHQIRPKPSRRPIPHRHRRSPLLRLLRPRLPRVRAGSSAAQDRWRQDARRELLQVVQATRPRQQRNPKPGDLIWWTKRGHIEHIGIYVGNGRAISALTIGVRRHRLRSHQRQASWDTGTYACRSSSASHSRDPSDAAGTMPAALFFTRRSRSSS